MKSEADLFPGLVLSSAKGSHLLHPKPRGQGTFALQHHALENMYMLKSQNVSFPIVTSILLIVLLYSVSSVSALLVSMICSLWSRSFWQIGRLACRSWEKFFLVKILFNVFQVSPGRWPWQGCPSQAHPRSEKKDISKRSRTKMSAIL